MAKKIIFSSSSKPFPYEGSENLKNPIFSGKNLNHCLGVFDSLNEAPGRTDCNAKNLNSVQFSIAEKVQEKK